MARAPITKARPYSPKSGAFAGQTFHTERQYRNALARRKGFRSWHEQQLTPKRVTPKTFGRLKASEKESRQRALEALSHMRKGLSLSQAVKEAGTTPNTVKKFTNSALVKRSGKWLPTPSDRLYRRMDVLTTDGRQTLDVSGSQQATLVGKHQNAVKKYVNTGDDSALRKLANKKVAGYRLETDPDKIEGLAHQGELKFEDIYQYM